MINVFERNIHFSRRIVIENYDTDTLHGNINIRCIKNSPSSVYIKLKPFVYCRFDGDINKGLEVTLEDGVPSIVALSKVIKKYHIFSEYNTLEILISELSKICKELDEECNRNINRGASDKINYSGIDIVNVYEDENTIKGKCPVRIEVEIKVSPDYNSEHQFIDSEVIVNVTRLDNATLEEKEKILKFSTGDIHFRLNDSIVIIMGNLRKIRILNNEFNEDEIKQLIEKHIVFPLDAIKRSFLFE